MKEVLKTGKNASMRIGQRSKGLNYRCIEIAKKIKKIEVDYVDISCEAADVIKNLTSERMKKKFN